MVRKVIHAGEKFNRWTATDYIEHRKNTKGISLIFQRFICDCGTEQMIRIGSVISNNSKSCGCLKRRNDQSHNKRLRNIWHQIIRRCTNPKSNRYKNYALRGITICDEWALDYKSFETWALNNGYVEPLTIERIDNDKGYYPENCTWIPLGQQALNRTTTKNK